MLKTQALTRKLTDASAELISKMKAQLGHIFDVDKHGNLTLKPIANIPPFKMIYVKGGDFMMGDKKESNNPLHPVKLSSFFMAEYPITQELYLAVTGKNPSNFQGINHPVEKVNWFEAMDFCNILNRKIGFGAVCNKDYEPVDSNGKKTDDITRVTGFRLPTESEWEYAARGGAGDGDGDNDGDNVGDNVETHGRASLTFPDRSSEPFPGSSSEPFPTRSSNQNPRRSPQQFAGSNFLDDVGWYDNNNEVETRPVGLKFPNALGIYDMSGNVWEWCWDWYNEKFFDSKSLLSNPVNLNTGSVRVLRGGSWINAADYCRMAIRLSGDPDSRWRYNGFRLLFAFQFT